MDNNQYSVVIRTLGTAGEKYQRLLNSIAAQTIQPKHIYVVMADGYALPPEQLGTEEFVFTKKGMWNQRIYGIEYCVAHGDELQLVCDDDIAFQPDFVERLMTIMEEHNADVLVPSIANSSHYAVSLPKKMLRRFLRSGYEDSHQSYAVRINSSAGFSVIGGEVTEYQCVTNTERTFQLLLNEAGYNKTSFCR